jgi:putative glutamine amidotransferase
MAARVALLVGRDPAHRYSLHRGYADAVWAAGATPVVLTPPPDERGVQQYVEAALACDALCLTGGGDVDAGRYGAVADPTAMDVDVRRDGAEIAAVRAAVDAGRAVLGICRGIQLTVVALGGTLRQHLPAEGFDGHWDEEQQYEPVHAVTADPGTLARVALGGAGTVNSIHHQAVLDPGPSLTATAWSDDGLIEAVEAPGVLGVQWHPERLCGSDRRHLGPFRWVVAA